MRLKITLILVLLLSLTGLGFSQTPERMNWGMEAVSVPPPALDGSRILANVGATAGALNYYYWVVVTYPIGSMAPVGPREVLNITAPAVGNTVTLTWPTMLGASTYTVVRTTTPQFPATCAACASAALAVTTLVDNGAVTPNAFTASGVSSATGQILLDNRNYALPTWTISPGRVLIPTFTQGSVLFAGAGGLLSQDNANLFWDDTNNIFTVGDNTPPTTAKIYALNTTSTAAGGVFLGVRGDATQTAGVTGTDVLTGVYGSSGPSDGLVIGAYGVFGIFEPSGTATTSGLLAAGVKGDWDDTIAIWTEYQDFAGGVLGYISDNDTAGPDAAVVGMLATGAVRTTDVNAAFRAIDQSTNADFSYGLDLYYNDGGALPDNNFAIADIRGEQGDLINNGTVGYWGITRGSGNFTGFTIEATTFANLPAAANGTIIYCSNCDAAAAGAGPTVCASTPGTGAFAFRLNGAWTCLGI